MPLSDMHSIYQNLQHALGVEILFTACCVAIIGLFSCVPLGRNNPSNFSKLRINIQNWIHAWRFLFCGRDIIDEEYKKAGGAPFVIGTPGLNVHLVSSEQHLHELSNAATDHLSLFGAAKQMLKPRYTCGGFDMSSSKKESNTAFLRAIRAKTPHLSDSIPKFHEIIDQEVSAALAQCSNTNNEGFKSISLTGLIGSIQDRFNILFYLGDEFSNNRDFMKWFKKYVPQAHVLCEALCLVPRPLRSYLAFLLRGRDIPRKKVYDFIVNEVKRRQENDGQTTAKAGEPPDLLDFIIKFCPTDWDTKRLADEMNFIAFSTSVLVATGSCFAIQDLVLHPEYIMPLRHELESMEDIHSMKIDELPILDSFIKESIRTNCFEAISYRRLALEDFVFFDGYKITKGDWVGIPQLSMLQDEAQFPNPTHFDGFRFSKLPRTESWKSTQYHQNWPTWGTQKELCPGRVYSCLSFKMIISYLLLNYDIELADKPPLPSLTWRSARLPNPKTSLLIRRRKND